MSESANPYQAPQSSYEEAPIEFPEVIPASKWLRFANWLIDYVSFILFSVVIGIVLGLVFGEAGIAIIDRMPDLLFGIIIMLIYYLPMEAMYGRTVGKLITGTKVVNEVGGKPSFGQIAGRTLCRFIPFEIFSFLGAQGRGWHDSIPKTYVIKSR